MQTVENLCVKYLMNEMEPDERFSFEESLRTDANLLIEVELMRKTLAIVKTIPVLKTPEHLTKSVMAQARAEGRKTRYLQFVSGRMMKYAAVFLAVGLSFSIGWAIKDTVVVKEVKNETMAGKNARNLDGTSWNDRQNILHIDSYNIATQQNPADSIALKNAGKLRLIDNPIIERANPGELLLTRTRK